MKANELDTNELKELATTDWQTFLTLMRGDEIIIMKARLLRLNGKSYQQICVQTGLSMQQARTATKNLAVKKERA